MTDLLSVDGLRKSFSVERGLFRRSVGKICAVDDLTFSVKQGAIFAIVGESGSGKTTLARLLVRLLEPDDGRIVFDGVTLTDLDRKQMRRQFRRRIQMVFQDPVSSLNPRLTVGETLAGPRRAHGLPSSTEHVGRLLEQVGLSKVHVDRYPHEFSGGQRQRIGIARAIAVEPDFVVADEPVSALDLSVQAQVLNLLLTLRSELGLTYVLIAHDLSVVRHLADRVAVMYLGRIVEIGDRDSIFESPAHPYTRSLLSAAPRLGSRVDRFRLLGEPPSPLHPPSGCPLHPRCPLAVEQCRVVEPKLRMTGLGEQKAACHLL